MSDSYISEESDQQSASQQAVFDIDQLSVNSDNQEAIKYLLKVREEANQAPKFTYFQEDENFIIKQTDKKFLIQPKGYNLIKKRNMNQLWQQDVIQQYNIFKNNIDQFKKLEPQSYNLTNFDLKNEENIKSSFNKKYKFRDMCKDIIPTLYTFHILDYSKAVKILKWLSPIQKFNYNQCLWIYCALTQLEDPLSADTMADMNSILQNCYHQEEAMTSVLITIIQIIFKQNYAD